MIASGLFQGLGYVDFFVACTISGLAILCTMKNGLRDSFRSSYSWVMLGLISSGIGAMLSFNLGMFRLGALVVASWLGWWFLLLIVAVAVVALDRRNEA